MRKILSGRRCFTCLILSQIGSDIDGAPTALRTGISVSISADGTRVAIGGMKSAVLLARVWQKDPSNTTIAPIGWTQVGGDIGSDPVGTAQSSVSISANGTRVAIGNPLATSASGLGGAGRVQVFQEVSGTWTQLSGDINGTAAGEKSGWSVSLRADGSILAIGSPGYNSDTGRVKVFWFNGSVWSQLGGNILGANIVGNLCGLSVSLNQTSAAGIGHVLAIGSPGHNSATGRVHIYKRPSLAWILMGPVIDGASAVDNFGFSVSLSRDATTVAIGAPGTATAAAGHVRVHQYNTASTSWPQLGSNINGEQSFSESGASVSLNSDGTIVAIGAPRNDGGGPGKCGHVRLYKYASSTWTQLGCDIDGEAYEDYSGTSVSLSDDSTAVAIGAPTNDGSASNAGHTRVYAIDANCPPIYGCCNPLACNYNPSANTDDGTCIPFTTTGNVTTSICAGDSYTWPLPLGTGLTYTTAQTNVTNVVGCNTATLNLTITPSTTTGSVTTSICDGQSYTWPANGVTYTTAQSGVTVVSGCNTATLNLTITPLTTTGSVTTSICAGDSYTWPANGVTYTTAQTGVTVVTGCNTATLNLTITPLTTTGSVTTSICAGGSYTWPANGVTYTTAQSGVTVVTGCNTATLNLTITPLTTNGSVTTSICAGDSYTWPANGVTYTTAQSGTTYVSGCNTATLNLTITPLITPTFASGNPPSTFMPCPSSVLTLPTTSTNGVAGTWSPAVNYSPGTTTYTFTPNAGQCATTFNFNITMGTPINGCTDPTQFNYNAAATCDDGSCIPYTYGCTDPTAANYNPTVNTSDNSCVWLGCTDPTATNYGWGPGNANTWTPAQYTRFDDGSCICCFCNVISGVFTSAITTTSVTINWNSLVQYNCTITQMRIRYRVAGATTWVGQPTVGTNISLTSKPLYGLTPITSYEYQFKIWYSNGTIINWHPTPVYTFTTI